MSGIAIGSIMFAIMLSLMVIRVPIGIAMFMIGAGGYGQTIVPCFALTVSGRNVPSFFGVRGSMR